MANTIELAAHFDGERIVLDTPFPLTAGTAVRVLVEETEGERKARIMEGIRQLGQWGKGGVILPDKYMNDRETYYDDDHRAGLD